MTGGFDLRAGRHVRDHVRVEEEDLELWWAALPPDVRLGLVGIRDEPLPEWYLANIPRGWLSTLPAQYDEELGAPVITLGMLDPLLREFIARKATPLR
jgi:hypothetical protein